MKEILEQHYKNLVKIGEGAMGEVWRATDDMLERDVAVKVMKPEIASQPDFAARFLVEARALAKINHPNIVAVYTARQSGPLFSIELEFVAGAPLDKIIDDRGAMPWREAADLIIQALRGLECAHAAGIIHRDIKPSNAIVTEDGTLKLMDFGIARVKRASKLTRTGYTLGTVAYMAPEQFQSPDNIDGRADLYSIGIMFYELLSGSVPFHGDTEFEILDKHVRAKPPSLDKLAAPPPAAVQRIIGRALEKSADKRYPDARAFREDLEAALAQQRGSAGAGRGNGSRVPLMVGGAAALVMILGIAAAMLMPDSRDEATAALATEATATQQDAPDRPPPADAGAVLATSEHEPVAPSPATPPLDHRPPVVTLELDDSTVVSPEPPPAPIRPPSPQATTVAAVSTCVLSERKIDRLVNSGDLKGAIQETAVALDAGCGDRFLEKRKELVARVRAAQ